MKQTFVVLHLSVMLLLADNIFIVTLGFSSNNTAVSGYAVVGIMPYILLLAYYICLFVIATGKNNISNTFREVSLLSSNLLSC